jgi:hypothetical protein
VLLVVLHGLATIDAYRQSMMLALKGLRLYVILLRKTRSQRGTSTVDWRQLDRMGNVGAGSLHKNSVTKYVKQIITVLSLQLAHPLGVGRYNWGIEGLALSNSDIGP